MPEQPAYRQPLRPEKLLQLDRLCDQFESEWLQGKAATVEQVLAAAEEELRPHLLHNLLDLETRYRQQEGRPLTAEEANDRFAGLGPWAVEVLAALGLEPGGDTLLLEVIEGPVAGQTYSLSGHASFFVGRGAGVHLPLVGDNTLSRVHFCVEYNPPQAQLVDCNSKNGTACNGSRLDPGTRVDLRDGDVISAGDVKIRVRLVGGEPTVTNWSATAGHHGMPAALTDATLPWLPGFRIEEEVGRGGMGVVYRARRESDGATVAVKTVLPALSPRGDTLARFQREVSILGQLDHPHIVRFHESGMSRGVVFFVMEFIQGASASRLVKQRGAFPLDRVVAIGCELLSALEHAHARGFVHRDVNTTALPES
jgi:serine/threonine-protein kinase